MVDNVTWLLQNPHFEFRPATIDEFLGPEYLNIESKVRPGLKDALYQIFGKEVSTKRISLCESAIMTGAIGIGKMFRPEELILTPSGVPVPIDNLSVGSKVIGSDGKPCTVTGIYRHENVQMYRMTFCDGTSIDSGGPHLWKVEELVGAAGMDKKRERVLSTEQLYNSNLKIRNRAWKFKLPSVLPVEYEPQELDIPPYSWGIILRCGFMDAGKRLRFDFGKADVSEILIRVRDELGLVGITPRFDSEKNLYFTGAGKAWGQVLRMPVDPRNRFIEVQYTLGSVKDRLALLNGLMDGNIMMSSGRTTVGEKILGFNSKSTTLLNNVVSLVRSLGGYSKIVYRKNYLDKVYIDLGMPVFWGMSHLNYDRSTAKGAGRHTQRKIVSIEKLEKGSGVCIEVDAPDHLYVARDYIVTHNTTFASIALPYMAHWVLCLKDPQEFYNLLPGSRIAFMQMSTSEQQAREVIFGDIKARIENSKWFNRHYPRDEKYTKSIRFPKDIWIIPGDSSETTFEGYNILGGILDEADSHKVTKDKDYAQAGYETIQSRIKSRYVDNSDPNRDGHHGLLIVIGQMKSDHGFCSRIYEQYQKDPKAVAIRMSIWESFGWDKYTVNNKRVSFWYDVKRKQILPDNYGELIGKQDGLIIEIPKQFKYEFEINPEKALRDLGGIPPAESDPFISQTVKIDDAQQRWYESHGTPDNPVNDSCTKPVIDPFFFCDSSLKRVGHIDIAYSGNGDAAAIAIGHVRELIKNKTGELLPYIVIDIVIRMRARPGQEILLSDIRSYVYDLIDNRRFRISKVTLDGFQSTDTRQMFNKRRIVSDYQSIDRTRHPYEDFREALYEDRIEFPKYVTHLNAVDPTKIDIIAREFTTLKDGGLKIDHPSNGSKDVADAIAGVVCLLMNDVQYRKGVSSRRGGGLRRSEAKTKEELFAGFDRMTATASPFGGASQGVYIPNPLASISKDHIPKRFREG